MVNCIICDKEFEEIKETKSTNHFLCSEECCIKYNDISKWDHKIKRFDIDIKSLNLIRSKNNLFPINEENIKNYI